MEDGLLQIGVGGRVNVSEEGGETTETKVFNFPPNCILGSNLISSSIHFIVRTTVNRINNFNRSLAPKSHCYWSCLGIRIRFVLGQFQQIFWLKNPMNGECK